MATGQSLAHVMANPGESALMARYLDRVPRGDPILRELVARIGYMLEATMVKGPPQYDRWFFWRMEQKPPQDLTGGARDVLGEQEAVAEEG